MNIFIQIYLIGFAVALFYVTYEFKKFCLKNNLDFQSAINNQLILLNIVLDSLGSWLTVLFYYIGRNKE